MNLSATLGKSWWPMLFR